MDGIRALSALAVVVFHSSYGWFPGGFLGVDVFFAISGYLITTNLLAEHEERQRLDLLRFYERRARRLLPGLILALVLAAILWPSDLSSFAKPAVGTLLYYANWVHVFAGPQSMQSLGHAWSLSIEEQFYIAWPLLLAIVLRWRSLRVAAVFTATLIALLAGTRLILHLRGSPFAAYASTVARIDQILVGALFAEGVRLFPSRRIPPIAAVASAGVLLALMWWPGAGGVWLYRWGFTAVAATAAIVVAFVVESPESWLARLLAARPLVEIGKRSYGVYLFHLPVVFALEPLRVRGSMGNFLLVLALRAGLTLAVAWLSYAYVERRFRRAGRNPMESLPADGCARASFDSARGRAEVGKLPG
jgi:peptidoglycan/LPS O-acetylase OafA/YrhL